MEFVDYTPNPDALIRLPKVDFVAIIGPTAAGKTTLLSGAIARDPSVHLVVVTTSRLPRLGEQDDVDYHFRIEIEMRARIERREYVQVAPRVLSALYATAPEDYATDGVAVMAVIADGMPMFTKLPFKRMRQIYVLPPSWEAWQARIVAHTFTPEQMAKRMDEARRSLLYARTAENLMFVINDDQDQATSEMLRILQGGSPQMLQESGRILAAELLKQL